VLASGYETGNLEFYSIGRVSKNRDKAIYWYTASANAGNEYAGYRLARLHEREQTLPENDLAVAWYVRSAKSGSRDAAKRLATIYRQGILNQPIDMKKYRYWRKQSELL